MQVKTKARQFLMGGILFAAVVATGCNSGSKEAEAPAPTPGAETKPATSTPPPPTAADSVSTRKMDTASIRPPVKTPNTPNK